MKAFRDFMSLYRLYRQAHPWRYAFKSAWRISIDRLPF